MTKQIEIACAGAMTLALDSLEPFQGELKSLSKENFEKLKKEILDLGFSEPISVWQHGGHNYILNGHQRVRTLKQMADSGYEIPGVPVNLVQADSIQEAKKKILALTSQYGVMERDGLYEFMTDAGLSLDDLKGNFRFPEIDLDDFGEEFFGEPEFVPQADEDEVPEHVEPKTKRGDLYQLGMHRLLCGDSTSIDDVEKLMGGEKADLWITDPPYGVSYRSNGAEDKHRAIENDSKPLDEMAEFWFQVASNAFIVTSDKSAYYWFACQGGDQMMMMMMSISRAAWKVRHELIWVKDQMVLGRCDYHYKHEPILYGWKQEGTHEWCSDRKQTSVLEFPRPKSSDIHPTMKPVDLVEYLMKNNSRASQVVLDTFGGSGTTMIAAEKAGRKARLIELDPTYCDRIVARWEKYTGQKAELLDG